MLFVGALELGLRWKCNCTVFSIAVFTYHTTKTEIRWLLLLVITGQPRMSECVFAKVSINSRVLVKNVYYNIEYISPARKGAQCVDCR